MEEQGLTVTAWRERYGGLGPGRQEIQAVFTLDEPKGIIKAIREKGVALVERVERTGDVTHGFVIAGFVDAAPCHFEEGSIQEVLPYHHAYYANGAGYYVNVPPWVQEKPMLAPARPAMPEELVKLGGGV
jgi:hypothetical protein